MDSHLCGNNPSPSFHARPLGRSDHDASLIFLSVIYLITSLSNAPSVLQTDKQALLGGSAWIIFFIQCAVRKAMHCNEIQWAVLWICRHLQYKKKSLESVAMVGWVCRWYCYHNSALFPWKRCLLAISLNEKKLQRSLLSHKTKYIYINSNRQTNIFIQELKLSFCGSTYIDHCVGNKTIHLNWLRLPVLTLMVTGPRLHKMCCAT